MIATGKVKSARLMSALFGGNGITLNRTFQVSGIEPGPPGVQSNGGEHSGTTCTAAGVRVASRCRTTMPRDSGLGFPSRVTMRTSEQPYEGWLVNRYSVVRTTLSGSVCHPVLMRTTEVRRNAGMSGPPGAGHCAAVDAGFHWLSAVSRIARTCPVPLITVVADCRSAWITLRASVRTSDVICLASLSRSDLTDA